MEYAWSQEMVGKLTGEVKSLQCSSGYFRPRGRPFKFWENVIVAYCLQHKCNTEGSMDDN